MKRLAGALGVEENSLRNELAKLQKKTGESGKKTAGVSTLMAVKKPMTQDEVLLLALAMEEPSFLKILAEELTESDFEEPFSRRFIRILSESVRTSEKMKCSQFLTRLEDGAFKEALIAASALEWSSGEEKEKAFWDCLKKIKRKRAEKRLEELRRSIAQAERDGNEDKLGVFVKEYQNLLYETRQGGNVNRSS